MIEKEESKLGICALCGPDNQETRELRKSHHLPKAVYKYFTQNMAEGTKLLLQPEESEKPFSLGKQVVQRLLCEECEQLMSAKGEKYVISEVLKIKLKEKRPSPVYYNLLTSLIPNYMTLNSPQKDIVFSVGSNLFPAINSHQLYHFAIGFIWKATFSGWPHCKPLSLDPETTEQMRRFLLGGDFVKGYIVRVVPSFWQEKYAAIFPVRTRKNHIFFSIQNFDFYLEKSNQKCRVATLMEAVPLLYTADKIRSEMTKRFVVDKIQEHPATANNLSWLEINSS